MWCVTSCTIILNTEQGAIEKNRTLHPARSVPSTLRTRCAGQSALHPIRVQIRDGTGIQVPSLSQQGIAQVSLTIYYRRFHQCCLRRHRHWPATSSQSRWLHDHPRPRASLMTRSAQSFRIFLQTRKCLPLRTRRCIICPSVDIPIAGPTPACTGP